MRFTAEILRHEGMDAAYVVLPFDAYEIFGAGRVKVKASFDGCPYRGSVVRTGGIYLIGVTKQIRREINKSFGDTVLVEMEKDEEIREVEMPSDFKSELNRNEPALKAWNSMSFSRQKKITDQITAAKKPGTCTERINRAVAMLSGSLFLENKK